MRDSEKNGVQRRKVTEKEAVNEFICYMSVFKNKRKKSYSSFLHEPFKPFLPCFTDRTNSWGFVHGTEISANLTPPYRF
jgi:hypothetical protein